MKYALNIYKVIFFIQKMESQRAFCFFIGDDIENMKNSTCTINSILQSFINSDRLVSSSESILTKDELQDNEHHLFTYLESKSDYVYEWIQYIFNAIIKYYKDVPEELKRRIQFLIHKRATFRNYKMPLEEAFNNVSDKEPYIINSQDVFRSIERENLTLLNIDYVMDTSIDMWHRIKFFFENREEDIFVQITSVFIFMTLCQYIN